MSDMFDDSYWGASDPYSDDWYDTPTGQEDPFGSEETFAFLSDQSVNVNQFVLVEGQPEPPPLAPDFPPASQPPDASSPGTKRPDPNQVGGLRAFAQAIELMGPRAPQASPPGPTAPPGASPPVRRSEPSGTARHSSSYERRKQEDAQPVSPAPERATPDVPSPRAYAPQPPSAGTALPAPTEDRPLSASMKSWLGRAERLADEFGIPETLEQIRRLQADRMRSSFRVVFLGEPSRGKSTLLNRLIGDPVLPTGPVPTTATFVAVTHGDEPALTIQWRDGSAEERPATSQSWKGLTVERPARSDVDQSPTRGSQPVARLVVDSPLLRDLRVELIDSPGSVTADAGRASAVRRVLMASDACVLVVSAHAPLSLRERELLESEVLAHGIPVVVVVSFLDTVPPADRAAVLGAVGARARGVAPGIPVLPGPGTADGNTELDAVRDVITEMARPAWRLQRRSWKVAGSLIRCCESLDAAGAEAAAAAAAAEHDAETERKGTEMEAQLFVWETLRAELDKRRLDLSDRVRAEVLGVRDALARDLSQELYHAPNPKQWWDRDLPKSLSLKLAGLSRQFEAVLLDGVGADLAWLSTEMSHRFDVSDHSFRLSRPNTTLEPQIRTEVTDVAGKKRLAGMAAMASTIVGYVVAATAHLPVPPVIVAAGASGVGNFLAQGSVSRATEAQRRAVDKQLSRVVDETCRTFTDTLSSELERLYGSVLDELRRRRDQWRAGRLAGAHIGDQDRDWARLRVDARSLADEIRGAMQQAPALPAAVLTPRRLA